ncbi:phosphoribosylanthranilate isomerase [Lutibaculum baratangense]|uniref:N-(5'-phosphoribosyl)anthranilate isomerase n=1 Tax=Lutibaculum baratangense AMV1 TaxID=631454 RepID=V4RS33_9HYPH|nr:phosphoribosylanthranilate isomerase [Lutibaculum baratangense]ESR25930.1 Phosphoribosylanthranilate isomerase [Lutibaculum baratangense AMV1]
MHVDIKICGMTEAAGLRAACDAGADLAGFVFFSRSPRNIGVASAAGLAATARERIGIVALLVDAPDDLVDAVVEGLAPDFLQLHGQETPERCVELRRRHKLPLIKAFGIGDAGDVDAIRGYHGVIDRILVDAKPPKDAERPGGLGRSFDWSLLDRLGAHPPLMLSGGLDAGNVGEAIAIAGPDGVDVSSGVESAPGRKDPVRIREFVAAVRAAEAAGAPAKEFEE